MHNVLSRTLALCSVCSDWRLLIHGTPLLWSHIPVGDSKHSHRLTQLCLERLKYCPIDIVACLRGRPDDANWQGQQELIIHASRVRSIYISIKSNQHVLSLLGRILGDQLPGSLTSLSIKIQSSSNISGADRGSYAIARQKSMQKNTAKLYDQLHTIHLDGVFIFDFVVWEKSSFGSLRELVLGSDHAYYEGMSHIMTAAGNLKLLEFHGPGKWIEDGTTLKPVLKPSQISKILRLHKLPFGTLRQGIKWIVPKAWETEMLIETKLHQPLWVLQNRSTVKALSLVNNEGATHAGYHTHIILEALPHLHTLTLEGFELIEPTLSGMTRPPDAAGAVFPRLSTLRLHSSRVLDHDTFKSAIASHPVQRLEIWNCELGWGGRETYTSSSLYLWLCEQVPEVYILGS